MHIYTQKYIRTREYEQMRTLLLYMQGKGDAVHKKEKEMGITCFYSEQTKSQLPEQ